MISNKKYSRREFIKLSAKTISGILLIPSFPSFLIGKNLQKSPLYVHRAFYTMGTVVTISAYGKDKKHINNVITKTFLEIQRMDNLMSLYKPLSQLSLINNSAGKDAVFADDELIEIIEYSKYYNRFTNGMFDITIEPLMELWGFHNFDGEKNVIQTPSNVIQIPSDVEIQKRLEAIGMKNIVIDKKNKTVGLKSSYSKIDLGGIAVGYSVDRAVKILKSEGIESAFINHSGDAYAIGSPLDSDGWQISIPNPINPDEMITTLNIHNKAISTSGNYRKYVEFESKRFGHIINPQRGIPVKELLSLTVISESSLMCDAISTGLFCMQLEAIKQFSENNENIKFTLIKKSDSDIEVISF
jgi:thiamine biosynthesis lipoprotein